MTADDRRRPVPPLPPQHPDLDTLADLYAGVLDESAADPVRRHLSGCAQCAGVLPALDAVREDLRALPTPPVPAAVASRLDATVAGLGRGAADSSTAAGQHPDGRADGAQQPGTRPADVPAADAVSAVGATGGDRPDGEAHPDRGAADLAAARERRRRRAVRGLGAVAAAVAVLAAGASVTALVRAAPGSKDSGGSTATAADDSAGRTPAAVPAEAGSQGSLTVPSYDRTTLRRDLPTILQRSGMSVSSTQDDTGPAGAMADPGRRTACAGTIRGSSGELTGVLRIRYDNRPAYLFVFADGPRRTAYVVADDCGTTPALPAAVLDTVS